MQSKGKGKINASNKQSQKEIGMMRLWKDSADSNLRALFERPILDAGFEKVTQ